MSRQVRQEKLWSRALVVLMIVNFCSALSFYLIMVKIVEFSIDTYSVAPSVAGLAITAYVISALVTRILFGKKIDAWGVKRALVIGSVVNTAAMVLYLLPLGFVPLLLVRLVHGFSFAFTTGSAAAGAALVIPKSRYGEGIGYYSMMQALATGIGPFVAIFITNTFGGYFPMFAIAAVVAALALVSLSLLDMPEQTRTPKAATRTGKGRSQGQSQGQGKEPATTADPASAGAKERGIGSFIQLSVVPIASVLFFAYLGYAGVLSFLTSYVDERGLTEVASFYFVVYAAVILVSRPLVGRVVDRKNENYVIYACLSSLALGFVVLSLARDGFTLLTSAALIGFGIGATQSVIQAVIARETPLNEMGRANSTFMMSMDLGSGLGPVIIGAFVPIIGYSACYLALAVVSALDIGLYHVVHGRKIARR